MSVQVIVQPAATLVLQQDVTNANVRVETTRVLEIITAGPQGARGDDGADGAAGANGDGQYPTIDFAFGDATPAPVLTVNPASAAEIALIQLEIEEAFDGVGAQILLGTAADPDALMAADQNDPSSLATYEASPRVRLAGGEQIILTITPGAGASQGRGKIIVQATPTA